MKRLPSCRKPLNPGVSSAHRWRIGSKLVKTRLPRGFPPLHHWLLEVLIEAAIIYWQVLQIDEVLRYWDLESEGIDLSCLAYMSPIRWDNVVLYGEYAMDRNLVSQRRPERDLCVEN